jgi:uncharacterized protein
VRVGVTGSSGLIGSALVTALRERGDDVVRFVRPDSVRGTDRVIRWDPSRGVVDDTDLQRVGAFDAVVNLAGAGIADRRWTNARKEAIRRSRTDAASLLVRLLNESSGTPFLASASAVGVYGSRGDDVLDESSSIGDDFLARVCADWERATSPLERSGGGVAFLRTGIVMSSRGGALKKQLPLFRFGLGGRFGSGDQWLSPISLRDEVRAIMWLLDTRATGPFNLVAPAALSNRDFIGALARHLHRPARLPIPAPALRLVLGRELVDVGVLASQRAVPTALIESGFSFEDGDIESILSSAMA